MRWRPYAQAREFVRALRLLDRNEWYAYARGDLAGLKGRRPKDIPFNPAREYRGEGWDGIRDWLGPPPLEPAEPGYLDFKRARRFARSLGISHSGEWRRWCAGRVAAMPKRPGNVPVDPRRIYPEAWRGWQDWLGSGGGRALNPRYLPFEDARHFARGLGLSSVREWRAFCRGRQPELGERPGNVPANPESVYLRHGWKGYADWLWTENRSCRQAAYVPYAEARAFAQRLALRSVREWQVWARGDRPDLPPRPETIPWNPHRTYRDRGWRGWGEFLGTGNVAHPLREFRSLAAARSFARRLGVKSASAWRAWCRGERPELGSRPRDIPACPDVHYRNRGWTGWGDFLGTGNVPTSEKSFRGFREARDFVRGLGLLGIRDWRAWRKGLRPDLPPPPDDIPAAPDVTYAIEGWAGWGDFLRTGNAPTRRRRFRSFRGSRAFARRLGFRARAEWHAWRNGKRPDLPPCPPDVPGAPQRAYAGRGWRGWGDFLGTGNLSNRDRTFRSYREARSFAVGLRLRSSVDWMRWVAGRLPDRPPRPPDIPYNPPRTYHERGWDGWADFLGLEQSGCALRRASVRGGSRPPGP
jgi:hypothetical protein